MKRSTKIVLGVAAVLAVLYYFKRRADAAPSVTAGPGVAAAANSPTGIIGAVGDGVAKIIAAFKPAGTV